MAEAFKWCNCNIFQLTSVFPSCRLTYRTTHTHTKQTKEKLFLDWQSKESWSIVSSKMTDEFKHPDLMKRFLTHGINSTMCCTVITLKQGDFLLLFFLLDLWFMSHIHRMFKLLCFHSGGAERVKIVWPNFDSFCWGMILELWTGNFWPGHNFFRFFQL